MSKNLIINKIITWVVLLLVGILPIFFLPFTTDFYAFNKNIFLYVFVLILLILWGIKIVVNKEVSFRKTPLDLPILAILGAFIISTFVIAPNKFETLWISGGTGTIFFLTTLYFIISNNISKKDLPKVKGALTVSALVLTLISFYQFLGLSESSIAATSRWAFLRDKNWTPAIGLLPLLIFLGTIFVLNIVQIVKQFKKNNYSSSFYGLLLSILIIAGGIAINLFGLIKIGRPITLPYSTSWAIAIESFKNWQIFFFGVGPVSFIDAFSQFKPLSYNLTPFWSFRFGVSGNFYLHLLSTIGILGLSAWLWLVWQVIKLKKNSAVFFATLFVFTVMLFYPVSILTIFTLFILLALLAVNSPSGQYTERSVVLPAIILIISILFASTSFYFIGRAYLAEVYFKQSLDAFASNNGNIAYDKQVRAIELNPFSDSYHIAYSQTNLALADSLAGKADLSDQDRQTITSLVQQSIREAKLAVALNRKKIINWENLAQIYRQLISFAEGADQWAITTTKQAISLDPNNPRLKLNLGGIYYAFANYDEAILWFQKTIEDKPNFANGYYNLSAAYREKADYQRAYEYMQATLSLITVGTEDYQKASLELEQLAKNLPAAQATDSGSQQQEEAVKPQLMEPEPLPEPVITPPLELPQESAPEINPAPSATN